MLTYLGSKKQVDFYPTPEQMADTMMAGIDWDDIHTVLEPSAGKGDLIKYAVNRNKSLSGYHKALDIDCIEIDQHLRHILKGEGYKVVHDDFLTFDTYKQYDLIIMNPPFSEGDKHLLKALKMQGRGGSIICLLNAETLKKPYTHSRKNLVAALEQYHADIQYIQNGFINAERKTDVEIALIKVYIPQVQEESDIYNRLKKAKKFNKFEDLEATDLSVADYIQAAITQYEVEVAAGVELIRQYKAMQPYMLKSLDKKTYHNNSILELTVCDCGGVAINEYVETVRYKYWSGLFANPKFTRKLTSNLQTEYQSMVNELKQYDFSSYNIQMLIVDMNSKISKGIEDTIMEMFDRLSVDHTWYTDCKNNRHYYDGWAHNKAHKINKKVIIPCYGVFEEKRWGGQFRSYKAIEVLEDIEKVFNFLDGGMSREVDLQSAIEGAKDNPKNIECKFFKVNFYKKGTAHIIFTNLDLLEKFNIYAAKNRNWLPPNYGKAAYTDMTEEEQAVIDDFQGETQYEKILSNKKYYLTENTSILMIAE